jgi:dTDP-4-amino-4,6-dideoxygalactose transaminase
MTERANPKRHTPALSAAIPFLDLAASNDEICEELDHAWHSVRRSGRFVGGEAVDRFEAQWAEYCGVDYCVGVSSGTAALELALRALGIGPENDVIVPANTFIATAAAVSAVGARPVFIDVDPATLLMTAAGLKEALTRRTAAVIVVHLYGQPADMDAINAVARAADIAVLEDAAQAHGANWQGRRAGALSDAGCFSFYPSKNLGAFGDAGAVVTSDPILASRIRSLSNHGRPLGAPHLHELIGSTRVDRRQSPAGRPASRNPIGEAAATGCLERRPSARRRRIPPGIG